MRPHRSCYRADTGRQTMPLRNPRPYSAIRVFDVPSAVHIVGAVLAAQLWIGIVDDTGAPDKWHEARGIPGNGLRIWWQVWRAIDLLLGVAIDDLPLGGRLIATIGCRIGRAQGGCAADVFARIGERGFGGCPQRQQGRHDESRDRGGAGVLVHRYLSFTTSSPHV